MPQLNPQRLKSEYFDSTEPPTFLLAYKFSSRLFILLIFFQLSTRHVDELTFVEHLHDESVGAEAGVECGDVILICNGRVVENQGHEAVLDCLKNASDVSFGCVNDVHAFSGDTGRCSQICEVLLSG